MTDLNETCQVRDKLNVTNSVCFLISITYIVNFPCVFSF